MNAELEAVERERKREKIQDRLSSSPGVNKAISHNCPIAIVENLAKEWFDAGEFYQWQKMLMLSVEEFAEMKKDLGK